MRNRIFLYDGAYSKAFRINEVREYLKEKLKLQIQVREDFTTHHLGDFDGLAKALAGVRVLDAMKPFKYNEPLYGEVEYEKRVLKNLIRPSGMLYDGLMLSSVFTELIPREERGLENVHLIFTDRLIATFDNDMRYHARTIVCGCPSIISLTGLVEAPAKPREFYLEKRFTKSSADIEILKKKFKTRFVDYEDERMTELAKGYAMQAVFYQIFHEPFCEDGNCRLYNAHWQEEMIKAQAGNKFCKRHQKMLRLLQTRSASP